MLTTTLANGDVQTNTYSTSTAEVTSIAHVTSGSSTIASYAYTYNSDGRKTQETLADGSYYSYGYDNGGQLTSESLNSGGSGTVGALHGYSYTYTYDAAGNRATKYNGTSTETYTYDNANKLTSAGVKSYSYDYNGNCTSVYNSSTGVTVTLGYDGESRMKSASDSASVFSNTYSYNGLDQRVGKVDNSGTFAYTRDGDEVDDDVLADGAAVYNHGAGDSELISEVRSGASKYYHSDALGSTGALTNSSGTTTDTHVTDAFGLTVTSSGSTPTPFGFVGQGGYQSDSDTGLMLCGHRYYDSSTGRFLSRDMVQEGYNWYRYCSNDPIDNVDTDGNQSAKKKKTTKIAIITIGLIGLGTPTVKGSPNPPVPPASAPLNGDPSAGDDEGKKKKGPGTGTKIVATVAVGAAGAGVAYGTGLIVWEIFKWGVAGIAAPETGGASLVLAGAVL